MSSGMLIPTHRLLWINLDEVELLAGGRRRDGHLQEIQKTKADSKHRRPADADLHKREKELLNAGLGI